MWGHIYTTLRFVCGVFNETDGLFCVYNVFTIDATLKSEYIQGDPGGKVNNFGSDNIDHCEKISHEHVSNSEWLPRQSLFESTDLTSLDFCLWCWVKGEVYEKKGGYTKRIARSRFGCCCPHKKRENQLRRKTRNLSTRVGKFA
jgi:hypothetical protein